jgi:hypothetical protein
MMIGMVGMMMIGGGGGGEEERDIKQARSTSSQ